MKGEERMLLYGEVQNIVGGDYNTLDLWTSWINADKHLLKGRPISNLISLGMQKKDKPQTLGIW
jgi:hypothetical protein